MRARLFARVTRFFGGIGFAPAPAVFGGMGLSWPGSGSGFARVMTLTGSRGGGVLMAGLSGSSSSGTSGTLAVVVANRHHEELSQLVDVDRIYFASQPHAQGILEAIDHYDFFRACEVPRADG